MAYKGYELKQTGAKVQQILDAVENKTIYPDATQQQHGLMSTSDKAKLDTIMVITKEEIELLFINP